MDRPRRALAEQGRAGPTHVGMDRACCQLQRTGECRPHARGDGPEMSHPAARAREQAPRTWGWTEVLVNTDFDDAAGPTHVGMDRARSEERRVGKAAMTVWATQGHDKR